jgi:CMP-N-acetylneuraminic acid synthetase
MLQEMTAIVPVRAGSQRVPGKNLRFFYESPMDGTQHSLLSWKIENLSRVLSPEQILVSSNWDAALGVAKEMGCQIHKREEQFCTADAPFDQVIGNIAQEVTTKHMVWAPATSPFITAATTEFFLSHYEALLDDGQKNGLIMTNEIRDYFFFSGAPLNFPVGSGHLQTQSLAPINRWSWALVARPTEEVRGTKYMFGDAPSLFSVDLLENFDVNDELEFAIAQKLVPLFVDRNG